MTPTLEPDPKSDGKDCRYERQPRDPCAGYLSSHCSGHFAQQISIGLEVPLSQADN